MAALTAIVLHAGSGRAPLGAQELAPVVRREVALEADSIARMTTRAGGPQKTFFVRRDLAKEPV